MKKILYVALAAIFLSSCATGIYLPGKSNFGMNTNVVLNQANFRIVRNLDVTVEINNTNLKRIDVERSAYAELLRQANLTGSQALANVVVEEVRREKMNLFGFNKHVQFVSAHASVIEFLDATGNPISSNSVYTYLPSANTQFTNSQHNAEVLEDVDKVEVSAPVYAPFSSTSTQFTNSQLYNEVMNNVDKVKKVYAKNNLKWDIHYKVFLSQVQETETNPTEDNCAKLQASIILLLKIANNQWDATQLDKDLRSSSSLQEQISILERYAQHI